jgi:hypothetical protein
MRRSLRWKMRTEATHAAPLTLLVGGAAWPRNQGMNAMRIVGALIVVIALASQSAVADVKRHVSIPEPLQGSWALSSDGCRADDKSVIGLAAKTYTSAETKCAVEWVSETPGPRGSIYSAHLRCTSQPTQLPSVINLIIRPDNAEQISVGLDFSNLKAYQRCPAKQ